MKPYLFLLCFVLCYGSRTMAQSNTFPFPTQNAHWSYAEMGFLGFSYGQTGVFMYVIAGDSVVNGITYQKYYRSNDSIFDITQATLAALFREDLATRRSYVLEPSPNDPNVMEEHLYYDFSLEVGDTLKDFYMPDCPPSIVNHVTYDEMGRKHIEISGGYDAVRWIEGIGNPEGLLIPTFRLCHLYCASLPELLCVESNGNNIYRKYDNSCYTVPTIIGINHHAFIPLKLSPNPVDTWVRISVPNAIAAPQALIQITDLQGKVVYQQRVDTSNTAIQLSTADLPNGMYFVHYIADQQLYSVARLVVQH